MFCLKSPRGLKIWKLQEILYSLGTEILQFAPLEAEKSVFKEGWGQESLSVLSEFFENG